jgi:DNA polymerase/3'-5' exonuclease PolX
MTPSFHLHWPKQNAKNRGASVLDKFDYRRYERQQQNGQRQQQLVTLPTHFIVSDDLRQDDLETAERMAQACSFPSLQEMADFCYQHGIVCATKAWAAAAAAAAPRPPPLEIGDGSNNTVIAVDCCFYQEPILKKEFPPREVYLLPPPTSRRWPRTTAATEPVAVGNRNKALSDLFLRLSKLLQSAPWNGMEDTWKSYSFNNIAGRLRSLDFEVIVGGSISPANGKKLKNVKGIGASTLAIIQEFAEKLDDDDCNGSSAAQEIERVRYLENDENRVAMRVMMDIHGVGPVKAKQLVEAGYKTIQQLRQDVYEENGRQEKRVSLNRNQYVGLLCYEDLLERMPASEVEAIAATVKQVVHRRFPSAEIAVMGSFRRKQRDTFGDVDILITHPDYPTSVPAKALGLIVDELKGRSHIAHHLTLISGMDAAAYDQDLDQSVLERLEAHTNRKAKKDKSSTSSTYMGIFNSQGKLRRVDIKFYPYRERVFASLYFCGNGYTNRAMRLWARNEGMQLNDHGLFSRDGKVSILDNPSTEKQVFDMLGLVYKEPHERDGFHAVVGTKKKLTALEVEGELELDKKKLKEFREAEQEHAWID